MTGTAITDIEAGVDHWRATKGWAHLVEQLKDVDTVINAAGAAAPDESDNIHLWYANVLLPAVIAHACAEAGTKRMVHISSASAQGAGPLDDSLCWDPFSPYSSSKAVAERYLTGRAVPGLRVVIYRPTSVMGPDRITTRRLARRSAGLVPVCSPDTALPLAHIDNVGDAAVFLASVDNPPPVATHPSEGVTVGDILAWSGGRALPIPRPVRDAMLLVLRAAGRIQPYLIGPTRRLELFLVGQDISASALTGAGWVPPISKNEHAALFVARPTAGVLRIAFLITRSDTIGGAQIHVRDLARAFLDRGHTVHVLIGKDGPYGALLRECSIPVTSVPSLVREVDPAADRRALGELKRILGELQPEILSTHSSKAGVLGRLAGRRAGIPTLFTAHGWPFNKGLGTLTSVSEAAIELACAPLSTRIICVSEHDRRIAGRLRLNRFAPTLVIPNAVVDIASGQRADPATEPPRLIMVARFDEPKRQDELLTALAKLTVLPYTVDFVGDGPKQAELERLANVLGIGGRCRFLGRRNDVEQLLGTAQIFVLVSDYEGMPRSILEAMRAGLPVVASRITGLHEVVVENQTGMLVDPHDVDQLATTLARLIEDPALRIRLGTQGRARYEERYDLRRLIPEMLSLYSEVVGRSLVDVPEVGSTL